MTTTRSTLAQLTHDLGAPTLDPGPPRPIQQATGYDVTSEGKKYTTFSFW